MASSQEAQSQIVAFQPRIFNHFRQEQRKASPGGHPFTHIIFVFVPATLVIWSKLAESAAKLTGLYD